ncbi:MAG: hypothetical protein U1C73_19595, partial [Dietzia sp.]|nr:hypothetical protein [Dietzia sp.]
MTTTNTANGPQDHLVYRMETSRDLLDWLGGEFAHRTQPRAGNGKDSTDQASSPTDGDQARTIGRLELQVARVCELVNLALAQVDLYDDLGMAWILLEQARQQLGHAAVSAATGSSSVPQLLAGLFEQDPRHPQVVVEIDLGQGEVD